MVKESQALDCFSVQDRNSIGMPEPCVPDSHPMFHGCLDTEVAKKHQTPEPEITDDFKAFATAWIDLVDVDEIQEAFFPIDIDKWQRKVRLSLAAATYLGRPCTKWVTCPVGPAN